MFTEMIEHRSLQNAEAEIQRIASHFRRPKSHRRRRNIACGIARRRQAIKDRASRVAQRQKLSDFVVSLPGGIVASLSHFAVAQRFEFIWCAILRLSYLVKNRVPARNN